MIISDISYQEVAVESNNLEGGYDAGISVSVWKSHLSQIGTMSASGPAGTSTMTGGATLDIGSIGVSFVGLGLP